MAEFRSVGAQVYGISIDSTWSHDDWRGHLNLPDDLVLLSDFNRDFGRAYDLLNTSPSGMKDILRRAVFVIGRDGKIAHRWDVPDPPRIPNPDEILPELKKLAA
jgi:glutaredoxin-dependent peroxiredoxin